MASTKAKASTPDCDRGDWEYVTYAPPGNTCSVCLHVIDDMDPARRGAANGPVVVYRHAGRCPTGATA